MRNSFVQDENKTESEKIRELAASAVDVARDSLIIKLRYLDSAVFALKPEVKEGQGPAAGTQAATRGAADYGISTDGVHFRYAPMSVLRRCSISVASLAHDYLHVLLHCIFIHFRPEKNVDQELWNLAADIAVEDVIAGIAPEFAAAASGDAAREGGSGRTAAEELQRFRQQIGELTAERIYNYFVRIGLRRLRREQLAMLFHVDEHDEWYEALEIPLADKDEESGMEADSGIPKPGDVTEPNEEGEPDWEQIAENIKMAIDMSQMKDDEIGGKMSASLRDLDEKVISYSDFLRKFAAVREFMTVDDASFDYIFYTYGMELYGDMPLIEPQETKEDKRVYDCVIVIDSSASTSGDLVEGFVKRTFDILKDESALGSRFNIRLIQCDEKIQEDVVLTSREEAEAYLSRMKIHGMGGTDFRTAFSYVDELRKKGAFNNLKGLIYFTDGKGVFPTKKPPYETAFVFADKYSAAGIKVPVWAIKAVLGDI